MFQGSYSIRLTNLALADNLGNPQAVSLGDSSAYTASFPGLGSHFIGYRLNTPSGRDFFDPVYEVYNITSKGKSGVPFSSDLSLIRE